MPVDTRDERASAISTARPFMPTLPLVDATVNQADRQQVSFAYVGILAGAAVAVLLPFIRVTVPIYMTHEVMTPLDTAVTMAALDTAETIADVPSRATIPPFRTDGEVPV